LNFEFFVAARYLRAKRRQAVVSVITVISVIGVAAGVASLIVALAINNGFRQDLQDRLLSSASNVELLRTMDDGIRDWRPLLARLEKEPHVIAAAPSMYEQVLVSLGPRASGTVLKAVIPEYENKVSGLLQTVKFGSAATLNPPAIPACSPDDENCHPEVPPIILGKDLAATVGATINSFVMVESPQGGDLTPFGIMPKVERFKVTGIFDSGFYDYDAAWGLIRLADAQRLFGLGDVISVIQFKIDDIYKAPQVAAELEKAAGKGFTARNWMEQNKALFHALNLEKLVTFITIGLIVFVAALNILISLIMMVMEKTRDIAVLMSMGARRRQVRGIFVFQGLLIGVVGTLAGLIVGYAIAFIGAKYHPISLSPEVYSIDYVPFAPHLGDGLLVALVAMFVSFVATLYPSWSAARVLPAEALRYE
jgi:lipoprotein-releasing system permease protein